MGILNSINVFYFINIFTRQIINTYKCDLYYEFFSLKFINKNSVLICFIREYEEEMECYQGENFPFRFLSFSFLKFGNILKVLSLFSFNW